MASGRPGDNDPVGDDLEIIELVGDERTSTARGPEPEAGGNDGPPRWRRAFVLAIAAVVVASAGVFVAASRDDGDESSSVRDAEARPRAQGSSNVSRTASDAVPGSTTIPPDERPPPTTPGDASTTAPLLPEGAPSTPHIGELIASVVADVGGRAYYLYADGRLISLSGQANAEGGMVEQRLTPEGVERVRSESLSAGQSTPDMLAGTVEECAGSGACVRGGDGRYLRILPGPVSPAHARLVSYMRTLDASLPKTEWADRQIRTYVPSRFNVCLGTYANLPDRAIPVQVELATVLSAFPAAAGELFASREAHGGGPPCLYSFETTLEEARALADIFLSPTGGGTHEYSGIVIRNDALATIQSDRSEGIVAYVSFQGLLPHSAPAY
jgi:hypothetical protein